MYNGRRMAVEIGAGLQDRAARPERAAYCMRALGKADLPEAIELRGRTYRLVRSVKHDFFAATGFYDDSDGRRVVLKAGRAEEFAGVSLIWLGRWLCRREQRFYSKLSDLAAIPKVLGNVGRTGFVLEFVPGMPLSACPSVPDGFFDELMSLIEQVHDRGLAYVDTNKTQNILVGHDGKPHLIDFQISVDLQDLGNWWLNRLVLRYLQQCDVYHVLKHKKRLRPDEMTWVERQQGERRAWPIRLHRLIVKPYLGLRRRTFQRLRATGRLLPEGSK